MQRFKNILLVLDPEIQETTALETAVSLARSNGARLTFISVLKEPPGFQGYNENIVQKQQDSIIAERMEWLRSLKVSIQADDIEVVFNAVVGTPFLEVIRQVLREQHDLVIITAEEMKGIHAHLFGTTSMHLMRKCPCPVWVVKRTQTRTYARILAAIDPSAYDPQRDSLNPLIMQLASSMARKETADLHIIHAWHLYGEHYVKNIGMTEEQVREAKLHEKKRHKQRFDDVLEKVNFTDLKPYLHLVEGHAFECIPELVMEQGIDLLIMGSVCRTGISGFLIGNTAEEVLNQIDCSVLVLKPEGFVTPVTLE